VPVLNMNLGLNSITRCDLRHHGAEIIKDCMRFGGEIERDQTDKVVTASCGNMPGWNQSFFCEFFIR
jgi:hypothetical protein